MARFTITINATLNGKTCKNPQVEFIQGSDVIYPCEISGNQITIETLPGTNPNACVEGYIKCEDECLNCPPQYFKKCLCNDITLLEACQICKDGLVEDVCTPEEIAAGKVCTPTGCQCPPDKPIIDPNTGQCVQCITGTVQGCSICVGGYWLIVDCGPNERCVDGECECIPPYVKDPLTGECKLQDECSDDSDCAQCETCVLGKCQPVQCPAGLQPYFVDGKCECVPECAEQTCNNGADCGENCGCLDGKCVPCSVLSCLDEASCQAALGCKCSGDNCVPVDNCGQDCSDTPCLDANCTCYNGKCVNCENFPCVETEGGCASYYNCQCNDEGKCGGGDGCNDKLDLVKKEVCSADGCELEATYTSDNKCMCDPIEFRVSNEKFCGGGVKGPDPYILLSLKVEMYKKGINYAYFKTSDKFSDDEVVSGNIKVITTVDGNTTTITRDISATNTIANIAVPNPVLGASKIVKISVIAESIKVNSNGCTNYSNKEIASYEFDFNQSNSVICTKLANYKTEQKTQVKDVVSTKKPLMVWYRSSSSDFGTGPISVTDPDYSKKGYFRKTYLTGTNGIFKDKISKPSEGLLNNFRYKVTLDCGCAGANVATTGDVVIFCCPKDLQIKNEDPCGKIAEILPFQVCSVNQKLDTTKYPVESNTEYYVIINGKTPKKLSIQFGNSVFIEDTEPIKSVIFYQAYQGNAVVKKACEKSFNFDLNLPDFSVDIKNVCQDGKVKVTSPDPSITISTVAGLKGTTQVNFTKNGNIFTSNNAESVLKVSGTLKLTVTFSNGCINTKDVEIICAPTIDGEPDPSIYAKGNCPEGGTNPKIVVSPSGFGSNVVYSLNGGPKQSSNEFLNLDEGVYTITATETINGVEYTATDVVTIEAPVIPTVSLSPANICQGQTSTLTITGEAGSVFTVTGPTGSTISIVVLGPTGEATVPGLTEAGDYFVTLQNDAPSKSCYPFSSSVPLTVGGQQLTPTIEVQPGTYCVGQPIPFRILDNGANATYTLDALGTGLITSPLQASPFAYNGTFTPNTTSGTIRITGVQGTCNTTTNPQINVTASASPVITSATAICQPNNQHTVTVVATGATGVNIGGIAATNTAPNTWQRTNISGLTSALIIVTNGACEIEQTIQLQNCLCPTGEVFIQTDGNTCGQGTTNIYYNGSTLSPDTNWTYVFQDLNFGNWIDINIPVVFNPLSTPNLAANTVVNFPRSYRLKLINTANGCEYVSDSVTVTGTQPPVGVTINPSIPSPVLAGTTVTFSTVQGYQDYSWTINGADFGNTYQSNPITFTNPGYYTIAVSVCSGNDETCCVATSIGFTVNTNCSSNISITPGALTACSDITANVGGGVGQRTYTATSTGGYINITSTPVPNSSIITIPTNTIPAGVSTDVTITVTDANGCTGQVVVPYTRCSISEFQLINAIPNSQACSSNQWRFKYDAIYASPCTSAATNLFFEVIVDNGITETVISSTTATPPPLSNSTFQCRTNLSYSTGNFVIVDLTTFGGQTVDIKLKGYLGTNNTGTVIGTDDIYTAQVLPASC